MTIGEAFREIRTWATSGKRSISKSNALRYVCAFDYSSDIAFGHGMSREYGEKTQLLYILANLQYFRGAMAKEVKETLRREIDKREGK